MKRVLSMVALAALTLSIPAVAHAQGSDDAETTKMAKEHYMLGLDAYKAGNYEVAIKELKKAYLLKRLPALLLNIGATYRKMGEPDLALHFYQKYLDEAPPDARDRGEVQQTIADINAEKASLNPPAGNSAPPPEERPARHQAAKTPMPREWSHTVIDSAPPDQPIDVQVQMPVMKGVKVWVYYRGSGEANFTPVLMKRHGPEKIGRIPADAVNGRAIQYYIEAKDASGSVVKSSGSQISPNIVMIDPSAPPQVVASLDQDQAQQAQDNDGQQQAGQGNDDERPPQQGGMDEEEAPPLSGTVSRSRRRSRAQANGSSHFGGVFWGGLVVASVGVAALAGGVAGLAIAKSKSNAVAGDSQTSSASNQYYFNNDPNVATQDAQLQSQGKAANLAGEVLLPLGGVMVAGGAIMMIVDQVVLHKSEEQPRRRRQPRRVDPDMESSIKNLYVAPAAGPGYAGAAGGFQF